MDLYSLPIGRKGVAVRGDGNCFYRVMALAIDGNSDKDDFFCVGIPKVVGSIPTVVRHIFQACPVWIYTQDFANIQAMCMCNTIIYVIQ
jgi:hypothetical protein